MNVFPKRFKIHYSHPFKLHCSCKETANGWVIKFSGTYTVQVPHTITQKCVLKYIPSVSLSHLIQRMADLPQWGIVIKLVLHILQINKHTLFQVVLLQFLNDDRIQVRIKSFQCKYILSKILLGLQTCNKAMLSNASKLLVRRRKERITNLIYYF